MSAFYGQVGRDIHHSNRGKSGPFALYSTRKSLEDDAIETEHDRRWRRLVAERKKRVEVALADGRITDEQAARLIELADTVSGFEAVFSAYTRKGDMR